MYIKGGYKHFDSLILLYLIFTTYLSCLLIEVYRFIKQRTHCYLGYNNTTNTAMYFEIFMGMNRQA